MARASRGRVDCSLHCESSGARGVISRRDQARERSETDKLVHVLIVTPRDHDILETTAGLVDPCWSGVNGVRDVGVRRDCGKKTASGRVKASMKSGGRAADGNLQVSGYTILSEKAHPTTKVSLQNEGGKAEVSHNALLVSLAALHPSQTAGTTGEKNLCLPDDVPLPLSPKEIEEFPQVVDQPR